MADSAGGSNYASQPSGFSAVLQESPPAHRVGAPRYLVTLVQVSRLPGTGLTSIPFNGT